MKTTTTATTATMKNVSIAYRSDVLRSNEKVVVWDIRNAFIKNDVATALSSIKTWLAMNDRDHKPTDEETVKMYDCMQLVMFSGKNATVKTSEREAVLATITSGRVKAWLYTFKREGYNVKRVETKEEVRPEEKQGKCKAKKVMVPVEDLDAFRKWQEAQAKKAE